MTWGTVGEVQRAQVCNTTAAQLGKCREHHDCSTAPMLVKMLTRGGAMGMLLTSVVALGIHDEPPAVVGLQLLALQLHWVGTYTC